ATEEKTATLLSGFGIGARAVAFLIIGGFLSYSAITANPQQARGLEGAITQIAQSAPGQVLVIVTGFGLLSYGIYCFVNALFRYIEPRQAD
ncbi:MAG: DUF1206 domain-containing protein, partial [Gammaproteobacteria bacterium]|nr:DUF1206 domain-containing protein [Gammaproteobacteria bacterium]